MGRIRHLDNISYINYSRQCIVGIVEKMLEEPMGRYYMATIMEVVPSARQLEWVHLHCYRLPR